jgi:GNAT superfamily N-acetyltransferase
VEGFIVFGASRDAGASRRVGEIWVLNVHPRSWRRGVGRALVEHALAALGTAAFGEVTLWTPARSPRARSFYEACGFRHDGAEQRRESFGNALEVRYRRVLGGRYSSARR